MLLLFFVLLFVLGTMFGSFASVIIYRLKSGEKGIWTGRSHCKSCNRNLSVRELVPVLSWVFQGGKCSGCKNSISSIYPILEITTGLLFAAIGYFLSDPYMILSGSLIDIIKLDFMLFIGFLTIIYVFYDILYLEIPESILLIANISVFAALVYIDWGGIPLSLIGLGAIVLGILYTIMLKGMKEFYDCLLLIGAIVLVYSYTYVTDISYNDSALLSGLIGALAIYSFFFLQILVSGGKWMGGGDLRIAILMGLTLGVTFSFAGVMLSYFLGSIIGIAMILRHKSRKGWTSQFNTQIPFGPFLAGGYFGVLFFATEIQKLLEFYL